MWPEDFFTVTSDPRPCWRVARVPFGVKLLGLPRVQTTRPYFVVVRVSSGYIMLALNSSLLRFAGDTLGHGSKTGGA